MAKSGFEYVGLFAWLTGEQDSHLVLRCRHLELEEELVEPLLLPSSLAWGRPHRYSRSVGQIHGIQSGS